MARSPVTAGLRARIAALAEGASDEEAPLALQRLMEEGRFHQDLAAPLAALPAPLVAATLLRFDPILRFKETLFQAEELYPGGGWPPDQRTKKGWVKANFILHLARLPELVGRLIEVDRRKLAPLLLACARTRAEWNDAAMPALRWARGHGPTERWVGKLAQARNSYRRGVGQHILQVWAASDAGEDGPA